MSTNGLRANSDLLFCPFCGGEAHIKEVVSACSVVYTVGCSDSECMGFETLLCKTTSECMGFETLLCKTTPEEAIAAWNRRAERTCRNASFDPQGFRCSECGAEDYVDGGATVWVDGGPQDASYCPHCGCKVVSE